MGRVSCIVSTMAPCGAEGTDTSDWDTSQRWEGIQDQLKISQNTVAAVIRRYRMSHSTINHSRSGRPPKMTKGHAPYRYVTATCR